MSNFLTQQNFGSAETWSPVPEAAQAQRVAGNIGAAVIQLSHEITFADIFAGKIPISTDSVVYDRSGVQLDTAELLTYVDVQVEGA